VEKRIIIWVDNIEKKKKLSTPGRQGKKKTKNKWSNHVRTDEETTFNYYELN